MKTLSVDTFVSRRQEGCLDIARNLGDASQFVSCLGHMGPFALRKAFDTTDEREGLYSMDDEIF